MSRSCASSWAGSMADRTETTLGEVVARSGGSIKTGPFGTTLRASEYSSEGVPIISVGEVGYGRLRLHDSTPRAGTDVTSALPEYLLREGDIVFGRKGAVDRSAIVLKDQEGWFLGSDGLRVRLGGGVDREFVAYQLQSAAVRNWLLQHASGSTLLSLNQGTLGRVPLTLPPVDEQVAVAEMLGALDDKIAANARLSATADALARELFVAAAGESEETVLLADLASNSREVVQPAEAIGAYVGLEHVPRRRMWLEEIGDSGTVTSAKSRFRRGDVLFGKLRPYFHKVVSAPTDGVSSTDILVVRAHEPRLAGFVLAAVTSDALVERAVAASEGTRMPRASWKDLASWPVPWPGRDAALELSGRVAVLRDAAEARLRENVTLAATRDTLLPQLMSGKLRVREAAEIAGL